MTNSDICVCGQHKSRTASKCFQCASKLRRKVERPSREQLEKELLEYTAVALGKKYGVSNVTISKWAKAYHLFEQSEGPVIV
jgi:hypothetical protein